MTKWHIPNMDAIKANISNEKIKHHENIMYSINRNLQNYGFTASCCFYKDYIVHGIVTVQHRLKMKHNMKDIYS
jgi:hypothetical protein